jgi:hypothetical protein
MSLYIAYVYPYILHRYVSIHIAYICPCILIVQFWLHHFGSPFLLTEQQNFNFKLSFEDILAADDNVL